MGNVKTTNTTLFDDGNGFNFVIAASTKRSFSWSFGDSVDHATHMIADGRGDEFLICRVVGRVRKKPIPVEVIEF